MKKYLLKVLCILVLALGFASCSSDDDNNEPLTGFTAGPNGVYILNSGQMGKNDASLTYYDTETKKVISNVFKNVNNKPSFGDVAHDMMIYGSKMYITVTNSNAIYITDLNTKIINTIQIKENNIPLNPRYVIAHEGKVYVSGENGSVLKIDTIDYKTDNLKTGQFTEEMTIVNNKLFVTNSRTPSETVSVINLSTFNIEKEIKVVVNPSKIRSDENGNIFVLSGGDYKDIKPTLQKIDPATYTVSTLGVDVASNMAINGDKLLLMKLDYSTWPIATTTFSHYDIKENKLVEQSFITDNTVLQNGSSLTIAPNGNIYIGTGNGETTGKMYIFSEDGKLKDEFSTGGLFPGGAYFVTQTK